MVTLADREPVNFHVVSKDFWWVFHKSEKTDFINTYYLTPFISSFIFHLFPDIYTRINEYFITAL